MKKQTSLITLGLMLVTPALAGGAGAPVTQAPAACRSIAQIVSTDPNFSTLATALEAAGLSDTLAGGQYTVFAPTNAAFAKLPSDTLAMVLNDPDMLRGLLTYHVVAGKVTAKQVMGMKAGKTVNGANVNIMTSGNRVMINGANVTRADVMACNGIIHVIDAVLMPPMAPVAAAPATTPAPAATTTVTTVTTAPAAFDITKIPATPLSGATVSTTTTTTTTGTTTDTATTETTTTDTTTTETTTETATTDTDTTETAVASDTLYDVIVNDERFSTLRDLLSDAGLTETLTSGEYTIFAPTNEAFEAMDQDQLTLIASDAETLRQLLQYHVVQGRVTSDQLSSSQGLTSLQGSALMPGQGVSGDPLTASNGTIYVVNQVYVPEGLVIPEAPADTSSTDTTTTTTATTATTTTATTTTTPATATTPATTTTTITFTTSSQPLVASLSSLSQYSTLVGLIRAAGLEQMLATGDYTIFAPTNEAFARILPADLTALQSDTARLRQVLMRHIVPGRVTATALSTITELKTSGDVTLAVTNSGTPSVTRIGDATVLATGAVETSNGPIYSIDTVLLPR
ncbi:fasciclin domain-containing protein [Deinococcus navajonensis]|uniref:Fasciclin domain-containing protein n=1 Tax=Deinococcus navajonensis TaxID=309884 RepID=A0ABV8XNJ6_9DEIO